MRRIPYALMAVLLIGCSDTTEPEPDPDPNTPPPASAAVTVGDNFYSPSSATVAVNGTVTWTWSGSNPHTLTFDDSAITSASSRTSGSTSRQFATAGEYTYYCTVHGRGMSGKVTVAAP